MTTRSYRGYQVRPHWADANSPAVRAQIERSRIFELFPRFIPPATRPPFNGVTTDGVVTPGLFSLAEAGRANGELLAAAKNAIAGLSDAQRTEALRAIDDVSWFDWMNAFEMPHGASLRSMSPAQRESILALLRVCLSSRGYDEIIKAMQLNEILGQLIARREAFGRWHYAITFFGVPSPREPWGWQLQGHHLALNCFILGDQAVMTPLFLGAEPAIVDEGEHAGLRILAQEEIAGRAMLDALSPDQQRIAVVSTTMEQNGLPPGRYMGMDQRMTAGAKKDNAVIQYEGLAASDMTRAQHEHLVRLVGTYVLRMNDAQGSQKMREFEHHLEDTHFAWIGKMTDGNPFYYKVHSPVILIEFDHHSGVVFNNDNPEPFHIHTVVRTPNGNDYGRDLLRQHYERHHKERPGARGSPDGSPVTQSREHDGG